MGIRVNGELKSEAFRIATTTTPANYMWFAWTVDKCNLSDAATQYLLDIDFTTNIYITSGGRLYVVNEGLSSNSVWYFDISAVWKDGQPNKLFLMKQWQSNGAPLLYLNGVLFWVFGNPPVNVSTGASWRSMAVARIWSMGSAIGGATPFKGVIEEFAYGLYSSDGSSNKLPGVSDFILWTNNKEMFCNALVSWYKNRYPELTQYLEYFPYWSWGSGGREIAYVIENILPNSDEEINWDNATAATHWESVVSDDANYIEASKKDDGLYDLIGIDVSDIDNGEWVCGVKGTYVMKSLGGKTFTCGFHAYYGKTHLMVATATHNTSTKTTKTGTYFGAFSRSNLELWTAGALAASSIAEGEECQVYFMKFDMSAQTCDPRGVINNRVIGLVPTAGATITAENPRLRFKNFRQ